MSRSNLHDALERHSLVLFIGSDLPSTLTNLPSRSSLAGELARKKVLDGNRSLADVAQRVSKAGNRWEFTDFLRNALNSIHKTPQPFHLRIVELVDGHKIKSIITTAYDNLLELAFQQAGLGLNKVVRGNDVNFINFDHPTIIKLYGDLMQPDTLIVTDEDHTNLLRDRNHEPIIDEVRRAFRLNTILFIGYNLADPDFRFIFDQVMESHFSRTAYAVWPGLSDNDKRMWRDRNIQILETDPFGILEDSHEMLSAENRVDTEIPISATSKHLEADTLPSKDKQIGKGQRWAVFVGVNHYEDQVHYGKLQVCVQDVDAVQKCMVNSGFDNKRMRVLTDETEILPTRDNILVALKSVADATEPDDLLLFYFSGHGDEYKGESYLVTRNGKRLILDDTAINVSRVMQILEQAPAKAKVIILDACHVGANIKGKGAKPMSEEFIRRVFDEAEGLVILASCKQGQFSYEWRENERSVFTHFLLEALEGQADLDNKGFVTVQDANRHVSNGVKLWASQRNLSQTPTLQAEVAGDIILVYEI